MTDDEMDEIVDSIDAEIELGENWRLMAEAFFQYGVDRARGDE
jgi:hypothetical protein